MTARERTVIRTIIRALRDGKQLPMQSLMVAYGLPVRYGTPVKDNVAALLTALVEVSNDG